MKPKNEGGLNRVQRDQPPEDLNEPTKGGRREKILKCEIGTRVRPKGTGAHYSDKIQKLSALHVQILKLLNRWGPLTKTSITKKINEQVESSGRPYVGGFSISGRLSELCGLGLIEMKYGKVQLYDSKTMAFRFRKKPVWNLTKKGKAILDGLKCEAGNTC